MAEAPAQGAAAPGPAVAPAAALALKLLGLSWEGLAEQLGVDVPAAIEQIRAALGMPGASEEALTIELDRLRFENLWARTQSGVAKGDTRAIRAAAQLLAKRPRRQPGPVLDPLRSAVRRGIARGLDARRIHAEFAECKSHKLAEITRLVKEETREPLATPQAQRRRRVAELEAIKRDAPDSKTVLASLRVLLKIDGSLDAGEPSLYEEIWQLVSRLADMPLPDHVTAPRPPTNQAERHLWRAKLQRLRALLLRSADDVAAFRRLGPPPVGVVIPGNDPAAQKVGRMSRINLYAQEHIATALNLAATNPALSPAQRAEAVAKLVATAAVNHQGAETSEFAKQLLDLIHSEGGGATGSAPKGEV